MPEPLYLSISQIAVLTECEQRWVFRKTLGDPETVMGVPLLLGSLLHELCQGWAQGLPWREVWRDELEASGWEEGFEEPEYFLRAWSIMLDWETYYGVKNTAYVVVGRELPFDVEVPGVEGVRIRGYLDELRSTQTGDRRTDSELRVGEYKSMGRWGREKMVPFDPQLWTYIWIARQLHSGVTGATFDAISTYAYKSPEPEKRFKKIELEYDERAVAQNLEYLQRAARRALELREAPALAVRNIGENSCRYCAHHRVCLTPWDA
jgi:hypothetical protein